MNEHGYFNFLVTFFGERCCCETVCDWFNRWKAGVIQAPELLFRTGEPGKYCKQARGVNDCCKWKVFERLKLVFVNSSPAILSGFGTSLVKHSRSPPGQKHAVNDIPHFNEKT